MTNHNHHHRLIHHHLLPPHTAARSTSTIQACAACRYQRRKCAPDCLLAPYFPHDRQRQFQNAHKLFGVSNITKIILHLDQPQKDEAMRTIIYQSDVRAQDPVGGCYRIIRELQRQIDASRADLEIVLQQLALCRTLAVQSHTQNHPHLNHDNQIAIIDDVNCDIHLVSNSDDLHLYDDPPAAAADQHDLRRRSLDLDLHDMSLQQEERIRDHDQYVHAAVPLQSWTAVNDSSSPPCSTVHAAMPLQSWTAVNDSSSSSPPPASADYFEVKPQPLQTLHASVCDEFKSLLIDDHIPPGHRSEFKTSVGNLFSEENHKVVIKEENEEHEHKDATLSTIKGYKATQIERE